MTNSNPTTSPRSFLMQISTNKEYSFTELKVNIEQSITNLPHDLEIIICADIPGLSGQKCVLSGKSKLTKNINTTQDLQELGWRESFIIPMRKYLPEAFRFRKKASCIRIYSNFKIKVHDRRIFEELIIEAVHRIVDLRKSKIRNTVIKIANKKTDLNSFYQSVLNEIIKPVFKVEAASFYLFDKPTEFLRLSATTGIKSSYEKKDIFYQPHERTNVNKCYVQRDMLLSQSNSKAPHNSKYPETIVSSALFSSIYFPLMMISDLNDPKSDFFGVLKLCNPHSNTEFNLPSYFHVVDIYDLYHLSEYLSVLTQNYLRTLTGEINVERIVHGLKAGIDIARDNVNEVYDALYLDENDQPKTNFILTSEKKASRKEIRIAVKDALLFLEDLLFQVEKTTTSVPLTTEIIFDFHTRILMPMVNMNEALSVANSSLPAKISNLKDAGSLNLPPVIANGAGLISIFRNLLENSIKYRKKNKTPKVDLKFDYTSDPKHLFVHFRDYGIGISKQQSQYLFLEKFRSNRAKNASNRGNGIGLHYCKETLMAWGGDIDFIWHNVGIEFVVKLRKYR